MYINTQTLKTYASHSDVRADFPLISLPSSLTDEVLASIGVLPVEQTTPGHNPITQSATELPPALVGGKWVQQWQIVDLPPEQIAANQAAAATAMIQACDKALTDHLDATAKTRRYDNRITCAVRAGYPGPFQADGEAFALWMDTCNALAYQLLAEIQAGTRPLPTDPRQLIAELPAMEWPQ